MELPHEEVRHGEVADEEARHVHLGPGGDEDDDDAAVAQKGEQEDDPNGAPKVLTFLCFYHFFDIFIILFKQAFLRSSDERKFK